MIEVYSNKDRASIILITYEAFPERFTPPSHDFDLCPAGRLLIITLGLAAKTELTREICERMNALAECVARTTTKVTIQSKNNFSIKVSTQAK